VTSSRTTGSLAAVLLTQRIVDVPDAAPFSAREVWAILERVDDPSSLLGADASAIAQRAAVDAPTAERMLRRFDAATAVAFELDDLEQSGIRVLSPLDDEFPRPLADRLGNAAPPLLYVAGDASLLSGDLIGIVGSRDVDEDGARVAREIAATAVAHGFGVVSGGARGVDRLAMNAALDAGGPTVGVLADSLLRTVRDADTRRAILAGSACLCTPFKPSAAFSAGNAMARNKVVYALAAAVVVVATAHESGGTWAGAVEALERGYSRVVSWTGAGAGPGNGALVERGAIGLDDADQLLPLPAGDELADLNGRIRGGGDQLHLDV